MISVGRFYDRLRRRILGPPDKIPRRLFAIGLGLALALALAGFFAMVRLNVETGASSLPYLRPVLQIVTSVWFYVILMGYILRRILVHRDRQYATQAADVTGYNERSVQREKYEATSADGATRAIVTDEDDVKAIEERIDRALETGEDDTISINPELFEDVDDEGAQVELESDDELPPREPIAISGEPPAGWFDRLKGGVVRLARGAAVAIRKGATALAYLLVAIVIWHGVVMFGPDLVTLGFTRDELELARSPLGYGAVALLVLAIVWLRGGEELDSDDPTSDPWLEQYKLIRLDLATTLDFSEVLWSLILPAVATTALILLAVQIWVPPWFYPPILGAGLLVGILNYARVNWTRSRRLRSLREDREEVEFSDLSVLVKAVELPERTTYHAQLAERRYSHDDRREFIEGVATRAYEVVNGVPVSPSIMEKQAEQLRKMQPDLHGFRDREKEHVMRWLIERVEGARHGLIPKPLLIEECIEHDIKTRGIGPVSRQYGKGYDPELVREAYRELVPTALVEQDIAIDGEDQGSITAVRLRTDPLPPEFGEIRAQFSSQFGGYAHLDPMYRLPDVTDQLEEEPIYVGSLGRSGS